MFLLGTTLVSYGLMLWLPQVLLSHRLLARHNRITNGAFTIFKRGFLIFNAANTAQKACC
jgi:hypothetical protein